MKFLLKDKQGQLILPEATRIAVPSMVRMMKTYHAPVEMLQSMSVKPNTEGLLTKEGVVVEPGINRGHPLFGINEMEFDPRFGLEKLIESEPHELAHGVPQFGNYSYRRTREVAGGVDVSLVAFPSPTAKD